MGIPGSGIRYRTPVGDRAASRVAAERPRMGWLGKLGLAILVFIGLLIVGFLAMIDAL